MIDSAEGRSSAAPSPCAARETISDPGDHASPLASDAAVKIASPVRNTWRRPARSASRPPSSMSPPVKSRYALTTHCSWPLAKPRSSPMLGSATFTTVASRMTMNCARAMRTRTAQERLVFTRVSTMRRIVRTVDTRVKSEHDCVAGADRSGRRGARVDAAVRVQRATADIEPVVASERLEDLRVLRQVALGDRGHDAARVGHDHRDLDGVADGERLTEPGILREAVGGRLGDHVHPEAARIEAAAGLELAEVPKGGGRDHAQRAQVQERALRHERRHAHLLEERGAELGLGQLVAMSLGVEVLEVGVVLIDREVLG